MIKRQKQKDLIEREREKKEIKKKEGEKSPKTHVLIIVKGESTSSRLRNENNECQF